jgi:hypothetical protein
MRSGARSRPPVRSNSKNRGLFLSTKSDSAPSPPRAWLTFARQRGCASSRMISPERASVWSVDRSSSGMPSVAAPATGCGTAADAAGAPRGVGSPKRRELLDRIAGRRGDRLRTWNVELGRDLRHRLRRHLRRQRGRRSASTLRRELRWCDSASGRRHGARKRGAEQRDELPPPHSITSSASASSDGGTVNPSELAVFRLMASSNLAGPSTGSSPTLAPLRMRST